MMKNTENLNEAQKPELIISDVISSFFLHYHNKYVGKKIKFIVDKNSTVSYGNGKYLMIVEEDKGYDTVLDMFFLEKCERVKEKTHLAQTQSVITINGKDYKIIGTTS